MGENTNNTEYIFDPAAELKKGASVMDDIMIEAKGIKRCFRLGSGEDFYALKGIDMQAYNTEGPFWFRKDHSSEHTERPGRSDRGRCHHRRACLQPDE